MFTALVLVCNIAVDPFCRNPTTVVSKKVIASYEQCQRVLENHALEVYIRGMVVISRKCYQWGVDL